MIYVIKFLQWLASAFAPRSKAVFEQALNYTFANEGGFSNDAADHGGATRYGITVADASKWRRRAVSVAEMKAFPIEEAKAIYKAWYWDTMHLDEVIHPGIATAMFDIGVVRGIGVPPRYAQEICGKHGLPLVIDGHIGPATINALNSINQGIFIKDFAAMAEQGFRNIVAANSSQAVFLRGWTNRARRLLTLASKV